MFYSSEAWVSKNKWWVKLRMIRTGCLNDHALDCSLQSKQLPCISPVNYSVSFGKFGAGACGFHLWKATCQMVICTYFYYMFKTETAALLLKHICFVNHTVHRTTLTNKIVKPYVSITAITLREESNMLITYGHIFELRVADISQNIRIFCSENSF